MLDKKVIKYTRDGMKQENLATGEEEMLTESRHAREIKYSSEDEKFTYGGKQNKEIQNPSGRPAYRRSTYKSSASKNDTLNQKRAEEPPVLYGFGRLSQSKRYAGGSSSHGSSTFPKTNGPASQTRYYYTAKVTGDEFQTHADLRKGRFKHIGSSLVLQAGSSIASDLEDNDNVALSAIGQSSRVAGRTTRGVKQLKSLWHRDSVSKSAATIHNTEYAAAKNGAAWKAAYARRNAAQTARKTEAAAKQTGRAVQTVSKVIMNPATWKVIAIVGAIMLLLLFITQMTSSSVSAFVGTTTDHPELTTYVMQLDTDFQTKITNLIRNYEKDDDNRVNVEGSNVLNTDPNALAILTTGDWTDIKLTPENKAKLSSFHNILNTYTVTQTDEEKQQTSGDGQTTTKTIHHITIHINVYTARNQANKFGYSDEQKKHVLEMLDFLDNFNGVKSDGGKGSPGKSYDDPQVQALITEADKYLGYPYVWGGSSPSTSFDCSGFVCWVFTHSGVHNLPRTTAQGIYDKCTPISPSDAKPGDIIFFTNTYPTSSVVTHVGIYVGNGRMIHCGDPISYTSITKEYWQAHFYSYGRLR